MNAAILALFGWSLIQQSGKYLCECHLCSRIVGLWIFDLIEPTTNKDDDKVGRKFDVIEQHR